MRARMISCASLAREFLRRLGSGFYLERQRHNTARRNTKDDRRHSSKLLIGAGDAVPDVGLDLFDGRGAVLRFAFGPALAHVIGDEHSGGAETKALLERRLGVFLRL